VWKERGGKGETTCRTDERGGRVGGGGEDTLQHRDSLRYFGRHRAEGETR